MTKLRNGSVENLKERTSIDTEVKKKLVVEGSAIPVMDEQRIMAYIKNGELIFYRKKNLSIDWGYFGSRKYFC